MDAKDDFTAERLDLWSRCLQRENNSLGDFLAEYARAWTAEIERLREELHDAGDGDTWREACGRCEAEIERLREELKTPNPERDFVNEFNGILAAKNAEIEKLREELNKRTSRLLQCSPLLRILNLLRRM